MKVQLSLGLLPIFWLGACAAPPTDSEIAPVETVTPVALKEVNINVTGMN
jgi:hypothetical protein